MVRSLTAKYREKPGEMELALESEEEKRGRFVFMWALIPLTRAIDTLVITIKDPNSALALKLREIYEENREFIEWRV